MNCIHCEEQLSAYLEDALDGAERAAVEAHLHSCEACSELLDGVRQVIAWKSISEPRFALALLTATIVLGWMGSLAGISAPDVATLRHPSAVYYRIGGWANRIYGDAVRSYYNSELVNAIQCQIQTRIEQFRENS